MSGFSRTLENPDKIMLRNSQLKTFLIVNYWQEINIVKFCKYFNSKIA